MATQPGSKPTQAPTLNYEDFSQKINLYKSLQLPPAEYTPLSREEVMMGPRGESGLRLGPRAVVEGENPEICGPTKDLLIFVPLKEGSSVGRVIFPRMALTPPGSTGFLYILYRPGKITPYNDKTTPPISERLKKENLIGYKFTLEFVTYRTLCKMVNGYPTFCDEKLDDTEQNKLIAGNVSWGPTDAANRICNLTLGAYSMFIFLTEEKKYTIKKMSDTKYVLEPPLEESTTEVAILQEINQTVDKHIATIKNKFKFPPKIRAVSKRGINKEELIIRLQDIKNIDDIKNNLIRFYKWKRRQYEEKRDNFEAELRRDTQVYKEAQLSSEEQDKLTSVTSNKLVIAYFKSAIKCINEKIESLTRMSPQDLQQDFMAAINDPKYGLNTILVDDIVDQLSNIIATLMRGYQAFSTDFQNIIIVGPAGVGKTNLAYALSFIFRKIHLLCVGALKIVTRPDLVAAYLGQTAPKTRIALYSSLESILFIDEVYQIGGCPREDQYGMESLTEIVNFLDKYIGISVVVAAGYEDKVNECFFGRNEGLRRRFPNKYRLEPYDSLQLFRVFLTKVLQSLEYDPFETDDNILAAYTLIDVYRQHDDFPNMGGDMLIFAGRFIRFYLSTGNVLKSLEDAIAEYCDRDHDEKTCQQRFTEYQAKLEENRK